VFEGTKNYNLDGIDFKVLREQTYETQLRSRVERAQKHQEANDSDDEIEDCPVSFYFFYNYLIFNI
jgi:hypothetical protein